MRITAFERDNMAKQKKKKKVDDSGRFKGLVRGMWLLTITGLLFAFAILVLVSFTKMPDSSELENPKIEHSSFIYSDDGQELGRYYRYNREWVTYDQLNQHVINALVATEDERFFSHSGIDFRSTVRAFAFLGKKGGASTITQQLAKLFFTDRASSTIKRLWQKLKEWTIAIEFEKRYTKEEIMAMYLNKFEFNYGAHGIQAAAQTYFGKNQEDLVVEEAAVLVGMLKNPSLYNPKRFLENAQNRRNVVLKQMVKNDFLTRDKYNELKTQILDNTKFKRKETYDGLAPYFRAELTKTLDDILDGGKVTKPDGGKYNIYVDGLKIYTTLDYRMQMHAEAAMKSHMQKLQDRYFRVWNDKDPWKYTGDLNDQKEKDLSLKKRKDHLNRMVRESDRYQKLRRKYLSEIISQIGKEVENSRWKDIDIIRMIKQTKNSNYIKQLKRDKVITSDQVRAYQKIMKRDDFKVLIKQWNKLQARAKKDFNRKRKMSVFAYTDSGKKTVEMSPMDSIKYHRKHMQLGSMAIEPQTGYVKTWVGGIDYNYFKFDHVNAKNQRQIGSTFKPFIYATAISNLAFSPCYKVMDKPYTIPAGDPDFELIKNWSPKNSGNKYLNEAISLKEGLRLSKNSISVWLMKQLRSAQIVKSLTSNMGIPSSRIPNSPSICLGAADLSVIEMTGAYTTFSNNGVYSKPTFIREIRDKDDRVIYRSVPEQKKALSPQYNYAMVDMLQYATEKHSYKLETEFGGKTGTTNDHRDGWFMGITPNLVVGTWVGGEDQWIRFLRIEDGQGGVMARPYFFDFMQRVEKDGKIKFDTNASFDVPEMDDLEIDCSKYEAIRLQDQEALEMTEDLDYSEDDELEEDM